MIHVCADVQISNVQMCGCAYLQILDVLIAVYLLLLLLYIN